MDSCTLCSECKGFVIFDEMGFESNLFSKAQNLSDVRLTIPLIYENPLLISSQNEDSCQIFTEEIQKPQCGDNNFLESSSKNCDGRDCTSSDSSLDNAKSFFRDLNSCFKTSNSFASSNSKQPPVDLELGRLVDGRGTHNKMRLKKDKELSSSSVSAYTKRTRTPNSSSQIPQCQVHGCNMDLSSSKEYHKRHRVCEVHSKTRIVIVNGLEQRFCQQCSRFHLLAEFDDGKRSCRRRLAGHNERRRKPVMDAHSTRIGKLLQSYRGCYVQDLPTTGTTSFICPEIFPRGTLVEGKHKISNWLGSVKLEEFSNYNTPHPEGSVIQGEQLLKSSLSHSMDKVFTQSQNDIRCTPFWLDSRSFPPSPSQNMTPLSNQSSDLYRNYSIKGASRISDSGCALSLLSEYSTESPLESHEIQMDRLNQYSFSQSRDNLSETYGTSRRIPSSGLKPLIDNDVKPCINSLHLKDPMIQMMSDFRNMDNQDRDGFYCFPLA